MPIHDLVSFLNTADLGRLNAGLDELDVKIQKIFKEKNADFDEFVSEEISAKDSEFFWWLVFLKANFLRGSDIISNKAFKQFISYCNEKKNNYYFEKFPSEALLLPRFNNPKYRHASAVEQVLEQIRQRHKSGRDYVRSIRKVVEKNQVGEEHLTYLELISELNSYKQIGLKISNAIVGEIVYQLGARMKLLNINCKLLQDLTESWLTI